MEIIDNIKKSFNNSISSLKGDLNKSIENLFDPNSFVELNPSYGSENSGVICGCAKINNKKIFTFIQNINSNSGAISKYHIEKILSLYDLALKTGHPIIGFFDSFGADLEDGNNIFKSFSKLINMANKLSGVVPQIAVINGICFGSCAVFASCFDIILMDHEANMGLDIGGKNSDLEYIKNSGLSHIIDTKENILNYLKNIMQLLPQNNISALPKKDFKIPNTIQNKNINQNIINTFDESSFIELQKGFGKHFSIGIASLFGYTVGTIISNYDLLEYVDANSSTKAARFIRFCDSYSIPIITFIDAEKFMSLRETAKISSAFADATSPKITVITGKAYGSIYTSICAKGMSDITFGWNNSYVSFLPPKTAVEILWSDKLKSDGINQKNHKENITKEYMEKEASIFKAANDGIVDEVIQPSDTRIKLQEALEILINKRERKTPKKHSNIQI